LDKTSFETLLRGKWKEEQRKALLLALERARGEKAQGVLIAGDLLRSTPPLPKMAG